MTLTEIIEKEEPSCVIARSILNAWALEIHMFHCVECRKWLDKQEKVHGKISLGRRIEKGQD